MKKLLIPVALAAVLFAGSATVSAAPAGNGAGFCAKIAENAPICLNAGCRGGRNAGDTETVSRKCPNDFCPNGGAPARDGTGYRGGANTTAESTSSGTPALDGTGYRGGRNGESTEIDSRDCPNDLCPNDGVPARDGTGYRGGRNR